MNSPPTFTWISSSIYLLIDTQYSSGKCANGFEKPNTKFNLSVNDIKLIENALHSVEQTREVRELLGKIHNQKNWYRPKDKIYVSGRQDINTQLY